MLGVRLLGICDSQQKASRKFKELITGNPLYEAGGSIELLEEIPD